MKIPLVFEICIGICVVALLAAVCRENATPSNCVRADSNERAEVSTPSHVLVLPGEKIGFVAFGRLCPGAVLEIA